MLYLSKNYVTQESAAFYEDLLKKAKRIQVNCFDRLQFFDDLFEFKTFIFFFNLFDTQVPNKNHHPTRLRTVKIKNQ